MTHTWSTPLQRFYSVLEPQVVISRGSLYLPLIHCSAAPNVRFLIGLYAKTSSTRAIQILFGQREEPKAKKLRINKEVKFKHGAQVRSKGENNKKA